MTTLATASRRGLLINVFGSVFVALATNAIVFAAGWNSADDTQVEAAFAPPGWAIGSIWVVLFASMGAARWFATGNRRAKAWITALIASCALYPFYTGGLQTQWVALFGTWATIAIAVAAIATARKTHSLAALLVVPVVLWSLFATAIIVENLRLS